MVGRNRDNRASESNTLYLVEVGPHQHELDQIAQAANRDSANAAPAGLRVQRSRAIPSSSTRAAITTAMRRSGIPVIFFTTGLHPDYHANTDDVSKIEFDKMVAHRRIHLRDRSGVSRISIMRRSATGRGARTGTSRRLLHDDPAAPHHLPHDLRQPDRLRDHHPAAAVLRARRSARRRSSIGLLFAVVLAVPARSPRRLLGDLSDRYGRRPVLIFSLAGTVVSFVMLALAHSIAMLFLARIVDGLSGGNISTARAYVADVTEPKDRARAYGLIGAAFGLGFIIGPALERRPGAGQLHRADLGGRGAHARRDRRWRGCGCRKRSIARRPARATRSAICRSCCGVPLMRRVLTIDFVYWFAFAIFQTTFALFAARRFGFDASRTGYFFAGVRRARRGDSGRAHPADRARAPGDKADVHRWASCSRSVGLVAAALAHSVHAVRAGAGAARVRHGLRPSRRCRASISRAGRGDEQGRVQGAASAVESLGRTFGPVWGNASLQRYGGATPFV